MPQMPLNLDAENATSAQIWDDANLLAEGGNKIFNFYLAYIIKYFYVSLKKQVTRLFW